MSKLLAPEPELAPKLSGFIAYVQAVAAYQDKAPRPLVALEIRPSYAKRNDEVRALIGAGFSRKRAKAFLRELGQ